MQKTMTSKLIEYQGSQNLVDSVAESWSAIAGIPRDQAAMLTQYVNQWERKKTPRGDIQPAQNKRLMPAWQEVSKKLKNIPSLIQEQNKRELSLREKIDLGKAQCIELREGANRLLEKERVVQAQLQEWEAERETLKATLATLRTFQDTQYSSVVQIAENFSKMEKEREMEAMTIIREQPATLSNSADGVGLLKLSAVLQWANISHNAIQKMRHLNGNDFLNSLDETSLRHSCHIDSWQDRKDILYLQSMLSQGLFPYSEHEKQCVVCACQSPEDLLRLAQDENLKMDSTVLKEWQINGRRALMIKRADISDVFFLVEDVAKQFFAAIILLQQMHNSAKAV